MSLSNLINEGYAEVDPGYISDAAMESLYLATVVEGLNPDEIEELVSESENYTGVFEAQKNIVRLNKQAKFNRAYKTAILQCASEDGRKEYKKLRTLWKMEAALFKKLEKQYKNKAMARARTSIKNLNKKPGLLSTAANRVGKLIDSNVTGMKKSITNHIPKGGKGLTSAIIKK